MKEFARILKSGGSLGLIWNFYDTKNWPEYQNRIFVPLTSLFSLIKSEAWTHEKNCPQYRTMEWLKTFDTYVAKEYYDVPLKSWEYKWNRSVTDEGFWNFLRSLSYINRLPPDEKQACPCGIMGMLIVRNLKSMLRSRLNWLIRRGY